MNRAQELIRCTQKVECPLFGLRALINTAAVIVQRFAFDAYGKTLTAANYTTADNALTMWLNPDGAYSIATGLTNHIMRWRSGATFLSLDSFVGDIYIYIYIYIYTADTK